MNNMTPFNKAWEILKYFRNPHDEERSYGGVSMRDHPLFGQPGYEGTKRDQPTERDMLEMDDPRMANMADDVLMETPPDRRLTDPPFNPFRGVNPFAENEMAEINEAMKDEKEAAKVGDVGRPRTIPMSPRGSVRGKGERQAFDKPKKPDWWRTLTGEE